MARLVFAPSAITDTREILTTLVEKAGQPVAVAYWDLSVDVQAHRGVPSVGRSQTAVGRVGAHRGDTTLCRHLPDKRERCRSRARYPRSPKYHTTNARALNERLYRALAARTDGGLSHVQRARQEHAPDPSISA